MSTQLSYTVDTTPMAQEMQSVAQQVKGTTAAVVTMQTAVIAAEKSGAEHVVTNVNRGFYALMRSQISQKIALNQSRVEALLMHLGYQKRRLLAIKTAMERDYGRIAARYLRLFGNINKELEKRVRQIDQPIFELVTHQMATSSNRMFALAGQVNTMQDESVSQSQQILMSRVKHDAQDALGQATTFLAHLGEQRKLTGEILISRADGNQDKTLHVPVLIMEGVNDASGNVRADVSMPQSLNSMQQSAVSTTLREQSSLVWHSQGCPKAVSDEFLRLLNQSSLSPEAKRLAGEMFGRSQFQTL